MLERKYPSGLEEPSIDNTDWGFQLFKYVA
jgi:hypothetical protein